MIDQLILRLLDRRGVWMTPVEIFAASPDYPVGDYVIADIDALLANGLLVTRRRRGSRLQEYGLPCWIGARLPLPTLRYVLDALRRLIGHLVAAI